MKEYFTIIIFCLLHSSLQAQTDASVEAIYTLGKIPLGIGNYNHVVSAKIANNGTTALNNLTVSLNVTGANAFTRTENISIASGTTTIVSFYDGFSSWNPGNNIISVSVPDDDNNSNNVRTYTQIVNSNTFSYADNSPEAGSLGFTGMLLTKYSIQASAIVNQVRIHISSDVNNIGNTIYGVVTNGNSITAESAPHVITAGDLNTYVSLDIISPSEIPIYYGYGGFFAGILMTSPISEDYLPLSYQYEGPVSRQAAYYFSNSDGSGLTEYTAGARFMIEAVVSLGTTPPTFPGVGLGPYYSLAAWDFSGLNSPLTLAATRFDSSLLFQPVLSRGPGAPSSPGIHTFRTAGFQNDGISVGNSDYFETSLSPKPGDTLSLSSIFATVHANNNSIINSGVNSQFAYSLDGTNFTLIGSATTTTEMNGYASASLTGIATLQNIISGTTVTFRYYASGEAAASGDWGFISYAPGNGGFAISGRSAPSNTILTAPVAPTGADFTLQDCNTGAQGSIGFTSTGYFSPTNKYLVVIGQLEETGPNHFRYHGINDTIGSLTSNANSGIINFIIPSKTKDVYSYILNVISTDPVVIGTFSQTFLVHTSSPYCASNRFNYYRSKASGNWNDLNIWESSPDGVNWIAATLIPTEDAYSIVISLTDTVTITTNVAVALLEVNGKLKLLNGSGYNGTLMLSVPQMSAFTPTALGISSGGIFQVVSSPYNYYDVFNILNGRIWVGGVIRIGDGTTAIGGEFDNFGLAPDFFWHNGSVLEWNASSGVQPRTDTLYFPNVVPTNDGDTVILRSPIFRITNIPDPNLGGINNTTINGILEANTPITWKGAGTKTFKDGVQGSSIITQDATSGEFITTESFEAFPATDTTVAAFKGVINGTVNVELNNTTGYTLIKGAAVPDTADVHISGMTRSTDTIQVFAGGRMTVDAASTLDMNNAGLINRGTLAGPGIIQFTGTDSSFLNSPGITTAPIVLINKEVYLSGNSNTDSISLTGYSHLKLDSFHLNMGSAPLNADSVNFIVTNDTGRLIRNVAATEVKFPIGVDTSSYTPVTVANSGNADNLKVRVAPGVSYVEPLDNGIVDRTWFIDSTNGGSTLLIKTQWNTGNEQGFDRMNSFIAQLHECNPPPNCDDGFYYDVIARTAALGTGPYTQSRSAVTGPTSFIVKSTADTSTFTNNMGTGDWNDARNWTIGVIPSTTIVNGKIIVIDYSSGITPTVIGNIIIEQGGQLIIKNGHLNVTGNIINH